MSSSTSSMARLNTLKSKATKIEFKDTNLLEPSGDILELFRVNTAAWSDSSNHWTIDVFPNMTPIMIYTMLISIRHAKHSNSSTATICMYHMSIVYGFFLLNDLYVRSSPSAHARVWSQTSWKNSFADFLIDLPMPEFLTTILSQFHAFATERTKNVIFVPSAAGFDHDQFFGRVFPLNLFAAIHDSTATNSSKSDVLRDLYSRVLYTITTPAFTCVIPDLIGITIDQEVQTTANHMNSKLFQVFDYVISLGLSRDCSSLVTLSFKDPTFATPHVNAYDLMFAATSANLRALKVVLQGVSANLVDSVPCRTTLGQFIATNSSNAIIKHGYSTFALPTWAHSQNVNKTTLYYDVTHHSLFFFFFERTHHSLVTEEQRAQDFSFLQRPNDPNLVEEDLVYFSDELNIAPSVLVLDTDGDKTISAHLPLLAGKIIESFELDGSTIEMPNACKSLGMQNCMFADSAIPYKYVRPGSSYRPVAAGSISPPLNRAPPDSTPRLPASSFLHNRLAVMLPRINRQIKEEHVGDVLPRMIHSFIGFRTVSDSNNDASRDTVPTMPEAKLMLWSPYTYTPYESDDYPVPDLSDSRHYYLTNLRTIFGTDFNLIQTKHPCESLPVF